MALPDKQKKDFREIAEASMDSSLENAAGTEINEQDKKKAREKIFETIEGAMDSAAGALPTAEKRWQNRAARLNDEPLTDAERSMDYAPPGLGERVKNRLGETAGNVGDKISDALPTAGNRWQNRAKALGDEAATPEERALGSEAPDSGKWADRAAGLGDKPLTDAERRLEPEASDTGKWADRAEGLNDEPLTDAERSMDYAPPGLGERVKNRLGETAGNVGDKISDALPNKWQDELDRIGEEPATDEERALGDFGTPNKRANQAWENRAGGLGDEPATDAERRLEPEASDTGKWADRAAALDQPEETALEKKSGQGLEERTGDALPTSGDRWENRAGGLGDEPATDAERALGNFQDPGNRANQAWENRASGLGDEPATDAERALGPETRDSGKWADKSKRIQKQEEAKAAVDSIQNTLRQEQNFFERKIQDIQLDIGEDRGKIKSLQNEIWQKRLDALLTLARYTIWIIILALALLILLVASILIITLPFTVPAMGSVLRSITTAFISLGRKLTKIYAEIKKKQGEIESLKQKIKGPVQEIKQVQQQFNQRRKTLQKQIQDLQKQVSK